ncbi:ANTH domain-containing protein [Coemansia mojavensis]|nr:ANTH domain-containing protein [Coemansia mojavensis]
MEKALHKATRKDAVHPKQKHVDTLIQMTLSGGSMEDLFMLVQDRFSEANWVISFKALIVVHILMHEGNGPAIYDYLIRRPNSLDMHRFRDRHGTKGVSEFEQSKNVRTYAAYLNDKVLAFKAIRIDHVTQRTPAGSQIFMKQPTDIKFMLLEVSTVQKQLHSVLKNRFDSDTLDNETTFSAFRYCLRDMLKLFQVMNFGVMKMLKVYFEMRDEDMRRALDLYKRFVKLTDRTAEYLKIARQFEAIFGFTIPNLNHAPLSLSRALEDFMNMPLDERKSTVSAMKSVPKKDTPRANSATLGPNGRPKPDYGLRLKPELLSGSPPQSGTSRKPAKPSAIASTSTLDQPTSAATDPDTTKSAAPAKEINFIDFFSSIDEETTEISANPPPQQQQQQQQQTGHTAAASMNAANMVLQQQQPAAVTDIDSMFLALSNPFAAASPGPSDTSTAIMLQQQQQLSATPFASIAPAQAAATMQPFNAFSPASFSAASNPAMGSVNNAFASSSQPMPLEQMPPSTTQGTVGSTAVAANNPFRQSMFPTQESNQQALMVSQMAQMNLQQPTYNPFTQRQTMYMDSTQPTVQQAAFSANSTNQFAMSSQSAEDPFAHFSTAFSASKSTSFQQQQSANIQSGNFANFDPFKQ